MGLISINIYLISRPSLHFQLQQIHVLSEIIFSFLHFDNQLNYRYLSYYNFPFKFVAYRVQGAHETFRMFTYQLNTALCQKDPHIDAFQLRFYNILSFFITMQGKESTHFVGAYIFYPKRRYLGTKIHQFQNFIPQLYVHTSYCQYIYVSEKNVNIF